MSLNIKNIVVLAWKVEDPVYPYQASYMFTPEEYAALDSTAVLQQQTDEYNTWLDALKAAEQGQ
jgi:hypothetical protein